MGNELLSLRDIEYSYPRVKDEETVLRGCDLDIGSGDSVAIVGQSGVGKSTILGVLGGLLNPNGGTYIFNGERLPIGDSTAMARFRRIHVGYVFQNFCLLPQLTLLENILLAAHVAGLKGDAWHRRGMQLMSQLGLEGLHSRRPSEISGGQAQRVAIARAMLRDPALLLADEPTGNLDGESATAIIDLMLGHVSRGGALVVVTHSEEVALQMRRTLRLQDGRVLEHVVAA
jgi:putative ABC transport system ATP-binding protein